MVTLTVKIIAVEKGLDNQGNDAYHVKYRVVEWPDLGPWSMVIPIGMTKAQAQAKINAEVTSLAKNVHEFYGIQWTVTFP